MAQAIIVSIDTDVAAKEVLAALRARLDPDPERAGRKYVLLRRKLVSFFEWSGADAADACADETLTTAAWKMTDGAPVQNVQADCVAIARTILNKQLQARAQAAAAPDAPPPPEPEPFGKMEALLHAFETGLDDLHADGRDLILTYYAGEQAQAIAARQTVAARLGLPLNQLRLRAYRTRSQLEQTVMAGLVGPASGTK